MCEAVESVLNKGASWFTRLICVFSIFGRSHAVRSARSEAKVFQIGASTGVKWMQAYRVDARAHAKSHGGGMALARSKSYCFMIATTPARLRPVGRALLQCLLSLDRGSGRKGLGQLFCGLLPLLRQFARPRCRRRDGIGHQVCQ